MAQQRRRRKHRGTQAGTVRRRPRSRPRSRAEARGSAEQRRQQRLNEPPTWRAAITRGGIAAASLFALTTVVLGAPPVSAIGLSLLAGLIYIPGFHAVDTLMYRRRQRKRQEAS